MADMWFVKRGTATLGPLSSQRIFEYLFREIIEPGDLLWRHGQSSWLSAYDLFKGAFNGKSNLPDASNEFSQASSLDLSPIEFQNILRSGKSYLPDGSPDESLLEYSTIALSPVELKELLANEEECVSLSPLDTVTVELTSADLSEIFNYRALQNLVQNSRNDGNGAGKEQSKLIDEENEDGKTLDIEPQGSPSKGRGWTVVFFLTLILAVAGYMFGPEKLLSIVREYLSTLK